MLGSTILEVVMGLVFVYFLLSLICSALQETLEGWFKVRATHLEQGLRVLLDDPKGTGILKSIYNHPSIYGLFEGQYTPDKLRSSVLRKTRLPSYMPAASFATALIDTLVRGPVSNDPANRNPVNPGEVTFDTLRSAVVNSQALTESVQRMLLLALDSAHGDLSTAQAHIETWFNNGMERVSGWYKRRTQAVLLFLGLFVAVMLNVDTLKVTRELYKNDAVRAGAVHQAEAAVKDGTINTALSEKAMVTLGTLRLPIGWEKKENDCWYSTIMKEVPGSLFGWLLTAFAVSLGAPFWFDMLNKLSVIRSAIKPLEKPGTEPTEKSKPVTGTQPAATAGTTDDETGADGCDVAVTDATPDEELPASTGGVANHA